MRLCNTDLQINCFTFSHLWKIVWGNHRHGFIRVLGEILDLRILEDKKNVICTKLGFKFPIPKSFFRKLDVAIAGAGSATLCCREHVPTIVADAGTTNAAGILGYTVSSSIFNPESDRTYFHGMYDVNSTPVALHMSKRVLTLPLYADLALDDVDRICDVILECKQ